MSDVFNVRGFRGGKSRITEAFLLEHLTREDYDKANHDLLVYGHCLTRITEDGHVHVPVTLGLNGYTEVILDDIRET